ncbi:hypothetical protein GCK32_021960, partial [Trichostrongylus colubriformis]
VGGEMPVGECAVLRDRPALRLDSRLVCNAGATSNLSEVFRRKTRLIRLWFREQ